MPLTSLDIELRVVDSTSASVRKKTTQAILERLHEHFNVTVADVGKASHATDSTLLVAAAAASKSEAHDVLEHVLDALSAHPRVEILRKTVRHH